MPSRRRGPVPAGGATISLFLGVRYERWGTPDSSPKRGRDPGVESVATRRASVQDEVTTADVA
ncbi:MAG: hypothetical protein JO172_06250 [Hyphomicrobiales bacterium]|nr:hypothetical protein [Hyphomicrobiales bacterium]